MLDKFQDLVQEMVNTYEEHTVDGNTQPKGVSEMLDIVMSVTPDDRGPLMDEFEKIVRGPDAGE